MKEKDLLQPSSEEMQGDELTLSIASSNVEATEKLQLEYRTSVGKFKGNFLIIEQVEGGYRAIPQSNNLPTITVEVIEYRQVRETQHHIDGNTLTAIYASEEEYNAGAPWLQYQLVNQQGIIIEDSSLLDFSDPEEDSDDGLSSTLPSGSTEDITEILLDDGRLEVTINYYDRDNNLGSFKVLYYYSQDDYDSGEDPISWTHYNQDGEVIGSYSQDDLFGSTPPASTTEDDVVSEGNVTPNSTSSCAGSCSDCDAW